MHQIYQPEEMAPKYKSDAFLSRSQLLSAKNDLKKCAKKYLCLKHECVLEERGKCGKCAEKGLDEKGALISTKS